MSTKLFYQSLEELRMLFPLISSFFFNMKIELIDDPNDENNEKNFLACIVKSKFLEKGEKSKEKYTLLVNQKEIKKFDTKVISGVILHEVLHVALSHLNTLEYRYFSEIKKDPNLKKIWNICVDYPINEIVRSFEGTISLPENVVSFKTLKELALILDVPLDLVVEGETSTYYYELFRKYYLKKKKEKEQEKDKIEDGKEKTEKGEKGKGEGERKEKKEKGERKEKGEEEEKEKKDILDEKISRLYEKSKLNDNHEFFDEREDEDGKNEEKCTNDKEEESFEKERTETWKEQFLKEIAKKVEEANQKQKAQGHGSLDAVLKFFQKIFAFKATIPNADEKIKQVLFTLNYEERENKSTIHPKTFLPLMYDKNASLLPVFHKRRKKALPTNIVFAFDTSGSMSSQDVLMGLSGTFDLLRKLQKKCRDENVSFCIKHVEFDYKMCGEVKNFDKVEDYINFLINKKDYRGGGGTLYRPVLEYFFSDTSLRGKSYLFIFTDGEESDVERDLPEIFKKYKHVYNRFVFFVLTPDGTEGFLKRAISNLSSYDRNKICLTRLQVKETKTQPKFLVSSGSPEKKFSSFKRI